MASNLVDSLPPPHAHRVAAGSFPVNLVDGSLGTPAVPRNPCSAILVEVGTAGQDLNITTYAGQVLALNFPTTGMFEIRGAFSAINASGGTPVDSVTVFWQ